MDLDMFNRTYRLLMSFVLALLLVSCSSEDEPGAPPSIRLVADPGYIPGEAVVTPGTQMAFKLEMEEGSEKLTNFYIQVAAGAQAPRRYFDTAMHTVNLTWSGTFYKSPEPAETWSFIVRDRMGGENSISIDILADTGSVYGPVQEIGGIVMGAQENVEKGGFLSFSSLEVYSLEAAQEHQQLIDMAFYYGEDQLTIASPGANIEDGIFPETLNPVNWEVRNTTRYIKTSLGAPDFSQVVNDSAMIALYIDAEGKRKAKDLVAGDVYVFRNQAGRLGLFLVNATDGTVDCTVNINVKIQPADK